MVLNAMKALARQGVLRVWLRRDVWSQLMAEILEDYRRFPRRWRDSDLQMARIYNMTARPRDSREAV